MNRGGRPSVSAAPALGHVDTLLSTCPIRGLTQSHIARLAGLGSSTIGYARRSGRMAPETVERLLAISMEDIERDPPTVGGRPTVSAEDAFAHIDRLIAACPGLTRTHVARLAGVSTGAVTRAGRSRRMEVDTVERILAVREEHVRLRPPSSVPATLAAQHIEMLMREADACHNTVARAIGISYQTVYNICGQGNRPQHEVKYAIAATILATTVEDVRAATFSIDRRATTTRLRALQANGWSLTRLGEMHGMNLTNIVSAPLDSPIRAGVAERIERIYAEIGDRPGGSPRAATVARTLGYGPPINYDEDMRLVEVDEVDEVDNEQARARTRLCILALSVENRQVAEITRALGCSDKDVSRARAKYGLRTERSLDGGYVAVERWPGAIAAIRTATQHLHYRSTLDMLDGPGVDYVARLAGLLDEAPDAAAA